MGRISRFPVDLRRRPYNTLALPCEYMIVYGIQIHMNCIMLVETTHLTQVE